MTVGCLYAFGVGEGQVRGRENVWVDGAVGVWGLVVRVIGGA